MRMGAKAWRKNGMRHLPLFNGEQSGGGGSFGEEG